MQSMIENPSACTVAFSSNEKGVLPLSVAIYSLLEHAQDSTTYNVIVCSDNISQESQMSICSIVKQFSERHSLSFIDMEDIYSQHNGLAEICGNWPPSAWARIFLPDLLHHTNRILYLDIDMLICDDCSSLFTLDMQGAVIGAVYESIASKDGNHNQKLGVPSLFQGYFNSGTLLIDVRAFCQGGWKEKILNFAYTHADELAYPDQDSMNAVMYDTVFRLHPRWNWNDIGTRRILNHHRNTTTLLRASTFREAVEASRFPGILHYCGHGKPWKYNYHITRNRYEDTLRRSGISGYNLREGWSFKIFKKRLTHALIYKLVWWKVRRMVKYFGITEPPPAATWGVSRHFAHEGWRIDNAHPDC